MILVALLCITKIYEDDVFWQLATGRWIVQHASIPDKDVFGFVTQGQTWIQYEWLWCVLTYSVYSITKSFGLLEILSAVLCGGMIAIQFLTMRRLKIALPVIILISLIVILNGIGRYSPRPQLITMIGLSVTMYVLYTQRYCGQSSYTSFYLLPLTFLLWANMHPGVLAGFAVLATAIVAEILRIGFTRLRLLQLISVYRSDVYLKKLIAVSFLCCIAVLVNPQGITMFTAIAGRTDNAFWGRIQEWTSPFSPEINMPQLWFYEILLVVGSTSIYFAWKRKDPLPALLYLAFALYSVRAIRLRVDFAAVTLPGTVLGIHCVLENMRGGWLLNLIRGKNIQVAFLVACLVLIVLVPGGYLYGEMNLINQFGFGLDNRMLPVAMIEFMKHEQISGRPFNKRETGGMLIWNLPKEKDFIDGRDLNDDIVNEYYSMYQLKPGFETKFEQYGIEYVLIHIPSLDKDAALLMTSPVPYFSTHRDVWKLVYWDDRSYLYLKNIPKFKKLIDCFEYKMLDPYLFAYCPHEFDSLKTTLAKDFRREIERKISEEPNGRVIQFIVKVQN